MNEQEQMEEEDDEGEEDEEEEDDEEDKDEEEEEEDDEGEEGEKEKEYDEDEEEEADEDEEKKDIKLIVKDEQQQQEDEERLERLREAKMIEGNSCKEALTEKLAKANEKVYKWMAGIGPNEIGQTIGDWDILSLLKMVEMADQEIREHPQKFVKNKNKYLKYF
jgi:hypothetical protein